MKSSYKQDQEKETSYRENVLKEMAKKGGLGKASEAFMRQHNVQLKFRPQKSSGANWTLGGNIHLNAYDFSISTNPANPALLSLVVHEVHHLRQGLFTALSV